MKLMSLEAVGDRLYASFDNDKRFEIFSVTEKDKEYFVKVQEHQTIRFYKIERREYEILGKKIASMGIQNHHQQNKTD